MWSGEGELPAGGLELYRSLDGAEFTQVAGLSPVPGDKVWPHCMVHTGPVCMVHTGPGCLVHTGPGYTVHTGPVCMVHTGPGCLVHTGPGCLVHTGPGYTVHTGPGCMVYTGPGCLAAHWAWVHTGPVCMAAHWAWLHGAHWAWLHGVHWAWLHGAHWAWVHTGPGCMVHTGPGCTLGLAGPGCTLGLVGAGHAACVLCSVDNVLSLQVVVVDVLNISSQQRELTIQQRVNCNFLIIYASQVLRCTDHLLAVGRVEGVTIALWYNGQAVEQARDHLVLMVVWGRLL